MDRNTSCPIRCSCQSRNSLSIQKQPGWIATPSGQSEDCPHVNAVMRAANLTHRLGRLRVTLSKIGPDASAHMTHPPWPPGTCNARPHTRTYMHFVPCCTAAQLCEALSRVNTHGKAGVAPAPSLIMEARPAGCLVVQALLSWPPP